MPITKRQFELGINLDVEEWMEKIYDHLAEHKDEAYSSDELASVLGVESDFRAREIIGHALVVLAQLGAVDIREVRLTKYYTFQLPFKKGDWERD
ncbi:MAG: hypothetical protein O6920_06425 [Chloroflexi bacterium]|nr:hypothetical protein [Chloroflexota bacterium]